MELPVENSTERYMYDQKKVIDDVLKWDFFTGAFEDIPQTVIVLLIIIVFDEFTGISFLSVSFSIFLIASKLVRWIINEKCTLADIELTPKYLQLHDGHHENSTTEDPNTSHDDSLADVKLAYAE